MTLADLLARFDEVEATADGFLVHCPAHHDSHQSLRLAVSDKGKVLVRCRAGCATTAVLAALGLTMRDLAQMTPGDVEVAAARSTDAPASDADVAALGERIDRYAAALDFAADTGRGTPAEQAAVDYARQRFGIMPGDVLRLGLGFADDLGGGPRLVVPFRDRDGVARGFQARSLERDAAVRWIGPASPVGGSWARVGYFPGGSGWDEVVIAEGPGDALTACAAGYDAIGVRGAGLASNPSVVADVAALVGDRLAIVAGDGDPSGARFNGGFAKALSALGIRVKALKLPDGLDLTSWREANPTTFPRDFIRAIATTPLQDERTAALLAWDEDRYALTDLGAARYLRDYIESLGSGVRYVEELGFYLLANGVWRRDDRQMVRTHAQAVADLVRQLAIEARAAYAESQQPADKSRAGRFTAFALHAQTTKGLDAMIRELQAVHGVPANPEAFDRHPDLLACRNGVIDLRSGELRPHDASLMLTRCIDLDYDPDAQAPRWERFLAEVFPSDPALPAYMRRLIGYGITGSTAEQCFAVLYGTGANGKSVLTDTLTEVFREITVTTPFQTFEERASGGIPNDLAALKGARLVMASEGEQGRPMAEAVLKRVTGRDVISARFMRKEFFEFRPTFLLLLSTNHPPKFRGQDEGLWRRVKMIPWDRYFTPDERDQYLGDKLLKEAPGILAWAVRGAVEWYRDGLRDPDVIRNATKGYREASDALEGFFPGRWIPDPDGRVTPLTLFHDFQAWADEGNFLDLRRWSSRAFYAALEERGIQRKKVHGAHVFIGIRRARAADAAADEEPEMATPSPLGRTTHSGTTIAGASLSALD